MAESILTILFLYVSIRGVEYQLIKEMTLLTPLTIDSVGLLQFIEQVHDIEKTLDPAIEFVNNNQDNFSSMEKMYISANHHISYRFSVTGLFQNNHKFPRYELIDIDLRRSYRKLRNYWLSIF